MPIQIEHVYSGMPYQQAIYLKYDWHGGESPSGCGAQVKVKL